MMEEEQVDAHPNYVYKNDMKFNRDNNKHERKYFNTLPRSHRYRYQEHQQHQIPRNNRVKFEARNEKVCPSPLLASGGGGSEKKTFKEMPKRKNTQATAVISSSASETEYESILGCQYYTNDDNSENETFFDDKDNDFSQRALTEMELRMNEATNRYFRKIKSQLIETCSKLNLQKKQTNNSSREKAKASKKHDEKAAGDAMKAPHLDDDQIIKQFQKTKAECYGKIEENLKILQQIDSLNHKLYKNYMLNLN